MPDKVDLTSKVREFKELQKMSDELSSMMDAVKEDIKAEMTRQGAEELDVDVFKVRWIPVVSMKFDTSSFKKTHADLYQQYCKESTSRRFTVS